MDEGGSLNRVTRILTSEAEQVGISVYGGDRSQIHQSRACRNDSLVQVSFSRRRARGTGWTAGTPSGANAGLTRGVLALQRVRESPRRWTSSADAGT